MNRCVDSGCMIVDLLTEIVDCGSSVLILYYDQRLSIVDQVSLSYAMTTQRVIFGSNFNLNKAQMLHTQFREADLFPTFPITHLRYIYVYIYICMFMYTELTSNSWPG